MRKLLVGAALAGLMAAPLGAQGAGEPITSGSGSFYIGPYIGYIAYGDFWEFPDADLTADNGVAFGAQAGFSFTPNISILANLAYNKSKFTLDFPAGAPDEDATIDMGFWMYDGNLQFRLPFGQSSGWIAPFAQLGAGAIKYTPDTDDFNAEGNTNFVFNAGLGADFQFLERIGMRFMVKDYITNLSWEDIGEVDFDDEVDGNTAHNWLISLGLNFGF